MIVGQNFQQLSPQYQKGYKVLLETYLKYANEHRDTFETILQEKTKNPELEKPLEKLFKELFDQAMEVGKNPLKVWEALQKYMDGVAELIPIIKK